MVQRLQVTLNPGKTTYPIIIGAKLLDTLADCLQRYTPKAKQCFLVSNPDLVEPYMNGMRDQLIKAGYRVFEFIMAPGEGAKSLETIQLMVEAAISEGLARNDVVIALGGGIVGDVAGLFASLYMRGISLVQVPTTLLAQVDSSVGGKVAVNMGGIKNIVGDFYQPKFVLIDTQTLKTLPERELKAGLSEVVKYAFIEDSIWNGVHVPNPYQTSFYDFLMSHDALNPDDLADIIARCCDLKAQVVMHDPHETLGLREILNLGHTFAHAYETLTNGALIHGEAVALGMLNAFTFANHEGKIDLLALDKAKSLIQKYDIIPESPPKVTADDMLSVMAKDKKNSSLHGVIKLILPTSLSTVESQHIIHAERLSTLFAEGTVFH